MTDFALRDVESILGISRAVIAGLVREGFVTPARGKRREYRFTFQDIIVLRTARELSLARIPPRKILRSLKKLRGELPPELPLTGLRISAVGKEIVVTEGLTRRVAESGQLLLDFAVAPVTGTVRVLNRDDSPPVTAEQWVGKGRALEATDPGKAEAAYRAAINLDACQADAYIDLALLLATAGRQDEAESVYREGILRCPAEPTLHFNLGVLLEDLNRFPEALEAYVATLTLDKTFADAHYNAARLHEILGNAGKAIRHYSEYRRLGKETD